jgi:hypothetical protein
LLHYRELGEERIPPLPSLLEGPEWFGELRLGDALTRVQSHKGEVKARVRLAGLPPEDVGQSGADVGCALR